MVSNSIRQSEWDAPESDDDLSKRVKISSEKCSLLQLFFDNIYKGMKQCSAGYELVLQTEIENRLKNIRPFILKCNDDVTYTDENGQTILHVYIANDDNYNKLSSSDKLKTFRIVKLLINRGASVDAIDKNGKTPLHYAAENHKLELIELMLDYCNEINICDNEGNNILHKLFYQFYNDSHTFFRVLRALVSKGANLIKKNKNGITPLHYAISYCDFDILKIFEEHAGDLSIHVKSDNYLNFVYRDGFVICTSKRMKVIEFLIEKGCKINSQDKQGFSILHFASRWDWDSEVDRLIELGANVHCQAKNGQTPLHFAATRMNNKCQSTIAIPALLYAGAELDIQDSDGHTPLYYALMADDNIAISYFLDFGADINDEKLANLTKNCNYTSRRAMLLRAYELKTLGFSIHKDYDEEYELLSMHEKGLWKREKNCLKEIEDMKSYMLDDGLSIYQYMHKNWRYQRTYSSFIPQHLQTRFPIYNGTIQNTRNEAIRRGKLMELAKLALCQIVETILPDVSVDRILDKLSNWNLNVLIEAAEITTELKSFDVRKTIYMDYSEIYNYNHKYTCVNSDTIELNYDD